MGSPALFVWLFPAAIVAGVLLLLLAPIGLGPTEIAHVVENACHGPLFALVAIGFVFWLRRCNWPRLVLRQYLSALFTAVLLGAAGEVAQSFTSSRDAEWIDLGNDLLGAIAGLSVYALYDRRLLLSSNVKRALCVSTVAVVTMIVLPIGLAGFMYWRRWQQLPQLVSWRSSSAYHFVGSENADIHVAKLSRWIVAGDEVAMQVIPLHESRWPGISINEPWPDWSRYSQLAVEIINPNDKPLELWVRIDDRLHNNQYDDRFTRQYAVVPQTRTTIFVSLADVRASPKLRQLDLTQIAVVILFQDANLGALPFYVCGVRLVR